MRKTILVAIGVLLAPNLALAQAPSVGNLQVQNNLSEITQNGPAAQSAVRAAIGFPSSGGGMGDVLAWNGTAIVWAPQTGGGGGATYTFSSPLVTNGTTISLPAISALTGYVDPTNANNIASGTIGAARLPAITTTTVTEGANLYFTTGRAAAAAPVQSVATRTGAVTLTHSDLTDWASATAGFGSGSSGVTSFNTRTGVVTLSSADVTTALAFTPANVTALASFAPLASPTFTGTPVVPGYETTVNAALLAPLVSPAFTGTPVAPTATAGTSTTQIATTAFATGAVATETGRAQGAEALKAPLASPAFTGSPVVPGYETTAQAALLAPLASPALTGTPTVPTASPGANTTQAASTAFVHAAVTATSPGGSSGQVQVNNSGAFGGLTNAALTALVQQFTTSLAGGVPASGGGTANYLRADGTWATPPSSGSSVATVRTVTASGAVTVLSTDGTVLINKTTGAATAVTLEASPATGATHVIKDGKGDAATNNITITAASGTIDGASNFVVNVNRESVTVQYTGAEWSII